MDDVTHSLILSVATAVAVYQALQSVKPGLFAGQPSRKTADPLVSLFDLTFDPRFRTQTMVVFSVLEAMARDRSGEEVLLTFEPLGGRLGDWCSGRDPKADWPAVFAAVREACATPEDLPRIGRIWSSDRGLVVRWAQGGWVHPHLTAKRDPEENTRGVLARLMELGHLEPLASARLPVHDGIVLYVDRCDPGPFEHLVQFMLWAGVFRPEARHGMDTYAVWSQSMKPLAAMGPWGAQLLDDVRSTGAVGDGSILHGQYCADEEETVRFETIEVYAAYEDGFVHARFEYDDDAEGPVPPAHEDEHGPTASTLTQDDGPSALWVGWSPTAVVERCGTWRMAATQPLPSQVYPTGDGALLVWNEDIEAEPLMDLGVWLASRDPAPPRALHVRAQSDGFTTHASADPRPGAKGVLRVRSLPSGETLCYLPWEDCFASDDHDWWPEPMPVPTGPPIPLRTESAAAAPPPATGPTPSATVAPSPSEDAPLAAPPPSLWTRLLAWLRSLLP